jgi:hypothetical protein
MTGGPPMLFALIAFLSATAIAAPGPAGVSARDYEDFESCYGSVEGAAGVLPGLRQQMLPDDFAAVEHAMKNLTDDLADLEMRLSQAVFGTDRNELAQAHLVGRIPWQQPENQSLEYWSRNAPMSLACFALTKRLNEVLPTGF